MEFFAQCLSIAGMACVVGSYLQKKKSALIAIQATGGALFAIHYLLLAAYSGFLMNSIAVLRGFVFYKEHRSPTTGKVWVWVISILCVVAYALSFILFNTPPTWGNLILELLPVIGMIALTISFNMTNAGQIRMMGFVNSTCWLIYNIAHVSIGGIGCEIMCFASIIIGIIRYDIKKNKE